MRNMFNRASGRRALSVLAACAGLLLAGCSLDEIAYDDSYKPDTVGERYPIQVRKATSQMGVVTPSGHLKPDQVNGVIAFANQAKTTSLSAVSVRYPSGSASGRAAAAEMVDIIAGQGVPEGMIRVSSYPGGAGKPVQLSFTRKFAVTEECGDWSRNLAEDSTNRQYPNFGCAYQNNIAAMVANPEDFERPRSQGPLLAANRTEVMKVYVENATAGDYYTLDSTGSTGSSSN